jgi:hypothetical protein
VTPAHKIRAAVDGLAARGVPRWIIAPPLYRLAWLAGFRLPPPLFQSYAQILLTNTLGFGLLGVLFISPTVVLMDPGVPPRVLRLTLLAVIPAASLFIGFVYGLAIGGFFRARARELRLPPWRSFRPET